MKKRQMFIVIPFITLLLQQILLNYTSGIINIIISFLDELYLIVLWSESLIKNQGKILLNKREESIGIFIIVFVLLGLYSNMLHGYQKMSLSIMDSLICVKFLLFYLGIRQYLRDWNSNEKVIFYLYKFSKIMIVVSFVLALINVILPIFPRNDYRYFMNSIQIFYPHPTYMAIASITLAIVIIVKNSFCKREKEFIYIIMALVTACLSLRSKAIAGVAGIILLYLYFVKFQMKKKFFAVLGVCGVAIFLGYDQLTFYFGGYSKYDLNFVRERLLIDSIKIANDFFPFGSGFGTFASNIAAENWSSLYNKFNYTYNSFLSDSFWPIVISQTGWIGLIIFLAILFYLVLEIFKLQRINVYLFWGGISILLYELICSVGESAFFNPAVCPLFLLLGIIINLGEFCDNKKELES